MIPSIIPALQSGVVVQIGALALLTFGFVFYLFKKIFYCVCLFLTLFFIIAFLYFSTARAYSAGAVFGGCGTVCLAERNAQLQAAKNYYGAPYGPYQAYYPYPQMPYHAFSGPVPYYFNSFPASPYRPTYMQDCYYCNRPTYFYR